MSENKLKILEQSDLFEAPHLTDPLAGNEQIPIFGGAGALYYIEVDDILIYGETIINSYIAAYAIPLDGWISAEAWTYASADSPVFQIYAAGDVTANPYYKLGNKVKCTNNSTTFYGFIVKVGAYDSGNNRTPVDLYGGTDYAIANSAITNTFISTIKSPEGFPLDPEKWTVTLTDTANRTQASPTATTWYNIGSLSIAIPIGKWRVYWKGAFQVRKTTGGSPENIGLHGSLSTANNSESDLDFTASMTGPAPASLTNATLRLPVHREKPLSLTSKTTYYLIFSTGTSSAVDMSILGAVNTTTVKCVCAYL